MSDATVLKRITLEVKYRGAADEFCYADVIRKSIEDGDMSGRTSVMILSHTDTGVTEPLPDSFPRLQSKRRATMLSPVDIG